MGFFRYVADSILARYYAHMLANADDTETVRHAANKLMELDVPIMQMMEDMLGHRDTYVSGRAAKALLSIDEGQISLETKVLCLLTLHREHSIVQLGPPAVPVLAGMLVSPSASFPLRFRVAYALHLIAKKNPEAAGPAAPALASALENQDRLLAKQATDALVHIGVSSVPFLLRAMRKENRHRMCSNGLKVILLECGTHGKLALYEKGLKDAAEELRNEADRCRHSEAMFTIAELMNIIAAKKNELARKEMEEGGLMLAGERPKPPKKDGGMYRVLSPSGTKNAGSTLRAPP